MTSRSVICEDTSCVPEPDADNMTVSVTAATSRPAGCLDAGRVRGRDSGSIAVSLSIVTAGLARERLIPTAVEVPQVGLPAAMAFFDARPGT